METIKDVLCFSDELDFTDNMNNDQIEKLRSVKQRLVIEFEDYYVSKLTDALNIIDEKNLLIMVNNLDARLEKTNSQRELVLYLISFKHFVGTNDHVNAH